MIRKIDKKKLQVKNSIIYIMPIIVKNIFPFFTIPLFTRILNPKDYGLLALAMIYSTLINGLANFGLNSIYDRNFFEYRNSNRESSQLLFSIIIFVFINFSLFSVLTYIFKENISDKLMGSSLYSNLLIWTLLGQFFISINQYYLAFFKNSENAKLFTTYTILISSISILCQIYFIVFAKSGIIGIAYSQFISSLLICFILTFYFIITIGLSFNLNFLLKSIKIGLPITPKIFIGVINTQFDKYFIGLLGNTAGVGIYSIAQKLSNLSWVYMGSLQNVFSPELFKRLFSEKNKSNPESIGSYLYPFIYLSILFTFFLSIFSKEIVTLLTPKPYHSAINIVSILCIYYGIALFRKFYGVQILHSKKTIIILIESAFSVLLNIGLNIILITKYGAFGAAIATLLTGFITVPIFFKISQKLSRISWDFSNLVYIYLLFIGFTIMVVSMRIYNVDYILILIFKIIAILSYLFLGFRSKVISKENYYLIKSVFSRSKK